MNTLEGIRLDILISGSMCDGKLEPDEEEGPASLSGVQPLGSLGIFQVFVVSDNHKGVLSFLQPVPPFPQRQFNGEQLPIYNIAAPLPGESFLEK